MATRPYAVLDEREMSHCEELLVLAASSFGPGKSRESSGLLLERIQNTRKSWAGPQGSGEESLSPDAPLKEALSMEITEAEANVLISCIRLLRMLSREKRTSLMHRYGVDFEDESWSLAVERARAILSNESFEENLPALEKRLHNSEWRRRRKLYIADCHFFHERLNEEMDMRGFSSAEEMNEHMIGRWNERVKEVDDVYILGDFSLGKAAPTAEVLRRLNGNKHLITGNHDSFLRDSGFNRTLFDEVLQYLEMTDLGRKVILSHYPIFCYNGQFRTDSTGEPIYHMLYGHVHNTQDERLVNRFIGQTRKTKMPGEDRPMPCSMINCFCMFSDYQPLTLEEWMEKDEERRRRLWEEEEGLS